MNHALLLNCLVVTVILVALCITSNPLALFGLFMLRDMPYGLLQQEPSNEEPTGRAMGFLADLEDPSESD